VEFDGVETDGVDTDEDDDGLSSDPRPRLASAGALTAKARMSEPVAASAPMRAIRLVEIRLFELVCSFIGVAPVKLAPGVWRLVELPSRRSGRWDHTTLVAVQLRPSVLGKAFTRVFRAG
jgi:hypothetical protein